jgi:spermidine synthase
MLVFLAVIPAVLIGLLYELKFLLFPPGTITGLSVSLPGILLLLFPVCFLSGYLFTTFSTLFSEVQNKNVIGKAYAWESIGSLVGGLVFSIILGRFFNTSQVIGLTTGAVLLSGVWLIGQNTKQKRVVFLLCGITLPVLVFVTNPDIRIKKILYPSQQIVLDKSTRYGNLIVTQQAGQLNFYENNTLQFYTENLMNNEEAVHFAMVQHKNPKQVLLISGGISGMIKEIQKYNHPEITYLETNPEIFRYWEQVVKESQIPENVEIVKSDIRTFLQRTSAIYDVILINLPAPSTLGYNRFYTKEFFGIIKRHCNAGSLVCTTLPTTANYAESNALDVNASLWKTMGLWFTNQLVLPGEKNYFLASDTPLSSDIATLVEAKKIENEYVNPYYFNDKLLARRSNLLEMQMQKETQINRDFRPYMFIKQTGHWLSHFGTHYYLLVLIPVALFVILFLRTNGVTAGLYTGGFTAASLEITLLLAYQIFVGSIYLATAFFFTAFMGGLATGSLLNYRIRENQLPKSYYLLQFSLAAFALLLPILIHLTDKVSGWIIAVQILFFILTFMLAFGIGFEFYLASKLQKLSFQETSGINYSTDLAGSAFGAFLTSIVLLPVLGLITTCVVVAALNMISGSWAALGLKSRIF